MSGRDVRMAFMIQCINILQKYLTQDSGGLSRGGFPPVPFDSPGRGPILMNTLWTVWFQFLPSLPHVPPSFPVKAGTSPYPTLRRLGSRLVTQ